MNTMRQLPVHGQMASTSVGGFRNRCTRLVLSAAVGLAAALQAEVPGVDLDQDGLPDSWEQAHGLGMCPSLTDRTGRVATLIRTE